MAKSKYKGLTWNTQRKVWEVYGYWNKQKKYLGTYHNEVEAAATYNAWIRFFGLLDKPLNDIPSDTVVVRYMSLGAGMAEDIKEDPRLRMRGSRYGGDPVFKEGDRVVHGTLVYTYLEGLSEPVVYRNDHLIINGFQIDTSGLPPRPKKRWWLW